MNSATSTVTVTFLAAVIATAACFGQSYQPEIAPASQEGQLALQGFRVPEGMEASLFAAEPLMANPVAFSIDAQGRFYVAETYRQQRGVEDNRYHMVWLHDDLALETVAQRRAMFQKHLGDNVFEYGIHHDRIVRLEDSTGDGKADRSTVFADGFNDIVEGTGAGVLALNGEVYYTCIPRLWKLQDDDDDGKADSREPLHDGFGVRVAFRGHDMHGLVMGPDGRVYFSIGDRGYNVQTDDGRHLARPDTGAVFRCEPDGSGLEVFAYGLRNPQELAFDDYGNLFTCDNNSDSGDRARWVHVVQGGDTGWRMYYQYLDDRGPWNREKLWHPKHKDQPAYIVPPIVNLSDGPSGLVAYPGVGLPDRYKDHFFLCDFRGSAANSGVRSFGIKPKGATFELTDAHEFVWNILGTDVDFGYDGAMYVSDWVHGWDGVGKGRIYRFEDEAGAKAAEKAGSAELMSAGLSGREPRELLGLLGHPDRRIRQSAQFVLVDLVRQKKPGTDVMNELFALAVRSKSPRASVHAIQAIGQIARRNPTRLMKVYEVAAAQRGELRALAFRTFFDSIPASAVVKGAADQIKFAPPWNGSLDRPSELAVAWLKSDDARVRSAVAMGLGRVGKPDAMLPLLRLLEKNSGEDAVLRHSAVMGLTGIGRRHPEELYKLMSTSNVDARMGVLLALRRLRDPAIARMLKDREMSIVVEAARAIHDEPIAAGLSDLADLAEVVQAGGLAVEGAVADALLRRILNANFRLGSANHAAAVAAFASSSRMPLHLRQEALQCLLEWGTPEPLDRVLGDWRPVEPRSRVIAEEAVRSIVPALLAGPKTLRPYAAQLAGAYRVKSAGPLLFRVFADRPGNDDGRTLALLALDTLNDSRLQAALDVAVKDAATRVRVAAREILTRRNPERAVKVLTEAIDQGANSERQAAIAALAGMQAPAADAVLLGLLEQLNKSAGEVPAAIHLDLLEAADARGTDTFAALRAVFEKSRVADDPLAAWRECLEGGDAEQGRQIFFGRTAASCRRCHKVKDSGGDVGPNLSKIGLEKKRDYLLEALVLPSKQIAKGFETTVVVMDSGLTYAGIIKSDTPDLLTLMLPDGTPVSIDPKEIDIRVKGQSGMPADLVKHLTRRDVRNLVEFLARCRGEGRDESTTSTIE